MSFWSSYRALTPKTRLVFGLGLMAWASIGMWASPEVENALGLAPTEKDQEELERKLSVRVASVEKGSR
ncbi:hypothetical protein DTO271G3_1166 [Paecilomyces variotii]|nr:hypothetical protein DTO271G3_1166 [Paecilomyces variotii]